MIKATPFFGALAACALLAGCGDPVTESVAKAPATATEPPPPAIVDATAPRSTLEICLADAQNTVAIDGCYDTELKTREDALVAYVAKTDEKLAETPPVKAAFDASQTAWNSYRDAHCGAVLTRWSDGTIRGSKTLSCRIDLTAARTLQVWKDFLTYDDSTLPDLPRPDLP